MNFAHENMDISSSFVSLLILCKIQCKFSWPQIKQSSPPIYIMPKPKVLSIKA